MIVSRRAGELVLVRQVDHQEQCGLMADAWGNQGFERPEPFGPVALAARVHDEGWRGWEERAGVGPDGFPVNFSDIDRSVHVALYRDGIARAAARDAATGLLVSLHGQGLYEGRRGLDAGPATPRSEREPSVRAFLAEQDDVQAGLRARIGDGAALDAWSWAGYRLLQTWDVMSLFLTWSTLWDRGAAALPQVPRRVGDAGVELRLRAEADGQVTCEPWPFAAEAVDLPVASRAVPGRRYASDGDLAATLAESEWSTLEFRLRPPKSDTGLTRPRT
ncbi:MAG TPA: DUF3891 family protein [Miltoncostaeaceae bacterium]|nr:DUF3891 family protein [Miltoncostaeaceae bacterium]